MIYADTTNTKKRSGERVLKVTINIRRDVWTDMQTLQLKDGILEKEIARAS